MYKILNAYCGIGGNRKLWNLPNMEITAIEHNEKIANVYHDLFPNDKIIVTDAHEYILQNYSKFDFIWSSPPCQTHSITNFFLNAQGVIRYPDMALYQEVILLQKFFKGKFVIENVKSYYRPLIEPKISGRHFFWANFKIPLLKYEKQIGRMNGKKNDLGNKIQVTLRSNNHKNLNFDLSKYKNINTTEVLNNCVAPEIGQAIIESAFNIYDHNNKIQIGLFS